MSLHHPTGINSHALTSICDAIAYWLRHDNDQLRRLRDAHREPSIWRIAPQTGVQMEPTYCLQLRAGSGRMRLLARVEADDDQEGRRSELFATRQSETFSRFRAQPWAGGLTGYQVGVKGSK